MDKFDYSEFEKSVHRSGIIMNSIGLGLLFAVPFIFSVLSESLFPTVEKLI